MRLLGLHLQQSPALVGTGRPSAVAEIDATGALTGVSFAEADDEVLGAIGAGPAIVAVDAPLVVPNARGRRDVEHLLSWCDIPAFPVSRARQQQVFGGMRAESLAARLPADIGAAETLPDLMLRMLMWEETPVRDDLDLGDYRARWLDVRPPRFRPKGPGRGVAGGVVAAWGLLARYVDLGGWAPQSGGDDWAVIRDAAAVDAIACAAVAWRARSDPQAVTVVGTVERGAMLVPVDAHLRHRIEVNRDRLRGEGATGI